MHRRAKIAGAPAPPRLNLGEIDEVIGEDLLNIYLQLIDINCRYTEVQRAFARDETGTATLAAE